MFHKVRAVEPLQKYCLLVEFETGEKKKYDVRPLFERWTVFRSLQSIQGLFEQVKVDLGGYGISWNDELDLSCDELYFNGTAA